jgi:hypothetical protein
VLAEGHRADLRASGLSDETIAQAGLYSAPERQVRDLLGYGAGPGLVIPYPSLNGNPPYARVKLDQAGSDGKRYRSPVRTANRLYVPPLLSPKMLTDPSTPLWLTEGEKKALKASQEGLACVALPGVWAWRTRAGREDGRSAPVPDLDHIAWKQRTVYVVFDSDLASNPNVREAEFALARELGRRGAKVMAIRLPGGPQGEKVGLDDYLMTHSVETLCALEPVTIHNPALRQGPGVVGAHELLGRTFAEQPAIIAGGIIVRGSLNILGGPPKVGKSSKAMNLGLCRSIGRPWLGFPTTSGRTLVLQAEIPERELQTRLRIQLQDLDMPLPDKRLYFVTHRGMRLDRPDGLKACRSLVEQVRPDLMVIDPLARFYSGDENSAREVGRLIGSLDDLIQTYGVAVLLIHHTSKPSATDPREGGLRLRGSSALFGAADTVMILDRDAEAFRLSFELRHGREPEPMRLQRTDHLWFLPAGPPEQLLEVAAIVDGIGLRHSALVNAVVAAQEVSKPTAERRVGAAVKAGLIHKDDASLYRRTITGHQSSRDGDGNARE